MRREHSIRLSAPTYWHLQTSQWASNPYRLSTILTSPYRLSTIDYPYRLSWSKTALHVRKKASEYRETVRRCSDRQGKHSFHSSKKRQFKISTRRSPSTQAIGLENRPSWEISLNISRLYVKLASRDSKNLWSIFRPTLRKASICSLKVLNSSFLSSGSRKAWRDESQKELRKRTIVDATHLRLNLQYQ